MALREVKGKEISDELGGDETGRTRIPSEPDAMDFHFSSNESSTDQSYRCFLEIQLSSMDFFKRKKKSY